MRGLHAGYCECTVQSGSIFQMNAEDANPYGVVYYFVVYNMVCFLHHVLNRSTLGSLLRIHVCKPACVITCVKASSPFIRNIPDASGIILSDPQLLAKSCSKFVILCK